MTLETNKINIIFATETGNSEDLAEQTATKAKEKGFEVELFNAEDFDIAQFSELECVVFFGSTWGEGEPPESGYNFQDNFIDGDALDCSNLKFAVVGLGDTAYDLFCEFAKLMDSTFEKNGGTRIVDRCDLDADFDVDYNAWAKNFFETLKATVPA